LAIANYGWWEEEPYGPEQLDQHSHPIG
jgi:hypothetical protein